MRTIKIDQNTNKTHAQIIGHHQLAKKLKQFLKNFQIVTRTVSSQKNVDLSQNPDFLYWFPKTGNEPPQDALINYAQHVQVKTIIICSTSGKSGYRQIPGEPDKLLTPFKQREIDACLVLVSDIYGPGVIESSLSRLWSKLHQNTIALPENDQVIVVPLYLDDAANAICKITFSSQTQGKIFLLAGTEELSILSLSFLIREEVIRRTGKLPRILYTNQPVIRSLSATQHQLLARRTQEFLSLKPETKLPDGIRKTVISALNLTPPCPAVPRRAPPCPAEAKPRLTGAKPQKKKLILALLAIATFSSLLLLPQILSRLLIAHVQQLSPRQLERLAPLAQFVGAQSAFEHAQEKIILTNNFRQFANEINTLTKAVLVGSSINTPILLQSVEENATKLLQGLSADELELRRLINHGRELLPVAQWALGFDKKRTLILVLQNSSELRPTGGFITAIGFITTDKGKLLDLSFLNTYQIDAQLSGQLEPPEPIRRYLGEASWWTRDANWSPDARVAANQIQQFVARATGRQTDGVVFVTTQALEIILDHTGPLPISNGDILTSNNLRQRATFQPQDPDTETTGNLYVEVIKSLQNFATSSKNNPKLIQGVLRAIDQEELVLVSSDQSIARSLAFLYADGAVRQVICPTQFSPKLCLTDSIMVVDANLGVNKADYYLEKNREIQIDLSTTNPTETIITLRYRNINSSNSRSGTTYKGYTRVILPQDTIVNSVVEIVENNLIPTMIDSSLELEHQFLGWYLEVPTNSEKVYRLKTTRPRSLPIDHDLGGYNLLLQKQPGTIVPTTVTIKTEESLIPLTVSGKVTTIGSNLLFHLTGDKSTNIAVEYATTR